MVMKGILQVYIAVALFLDKSVAAAILELVVVAFRFGCASKTEKNIHSFRFVFCAKTRLLLQDCLLLPRMLKQEAWHVVLTKSVLVSFGPIISTCALSARHFGTCFQFTNILKKISVSTVRLSGKVFVFWEVCTIKLTFL